MPFIDCRITKKLTEEKKEPAKAELGRAIPLLHKSETYLMVGIADGYDLWMGGAKISGALRRGLPGSTPISRKRVCRGESS